jgi:hypothetical protein
LHLGREDWCEFVPRDSGESQLSEKSIKCGDRHLARRGDLNADGPTGPREIDEHSGLSASGADAFLLSRPTRQVVVSRDWPSASKRDFEIGLFHGSTGYAVITMSNASSGSGSTMISHGRRLCRVSNGPPAFHDVTSKRNGFFEHAPKVQFCEPPVGHPFEQVWAEL